MQGYVCRGCLWMLDMVVLEHTPSLSCPHTFFTSLSLHFLFFSNFFMFHREEGEEERGSFVNFLYLIRLSIQCEGRCGKTTEEERCRNQETRRGSQGRYVDIHNIQQRSMQMYVLSISCLYSVSVLYSHMQVAVSTCTHTMWCLLLCQVCSVCESIMLLLLVFEPKTNLKSFNSVFTS